MKRLLFLSFGISCFTWGQETIQIRVPTQPGKHEKWFVTQGQKKKIDITVQHGKLLDARSNSYFAGTQQSYISPACLNNIWCHAIVGDPTSRAIYGSVTAFVVEGADRTYITREASDNAADFTVNAPVAYGVYEHMLYLIDDLGRTHPTEIVQKIANNRSEAKAPESRPTQ